MADKLSKLAKDLEPFIVQIVRGQRGGASMKASSLPTHALWQHTGTLQDHQAPQFLKLDGSRTLSGNLPVVSGVLIDGVDIDIHAADPDAHHDTATAGEGITIAPGTQVVAVDKTHNFIWTGVHQFNQDPQVQANLDFIGAADRAITAVQKLTIQPTGNLTLNPGGIVELPGTKVFQTTTFSDLPTGIDGFMLWDRGANYRQLTIGALKVDELYARVFVADETRIDRGEEYWSKSYGVVQEDFTQPADEGTVDVWFEDSPGLASANLFSVGDWLLFRTIDWSTGLVIQKVWYQVQSKLSADTTNDRQRWRIQRKVGGTTGTVIKRGSVALDVGQLGQGWIHLSALAQDGGPFIQAGSMTTAGTASAAPVFTNYVRMGNLKGIGGIGTDTWGFAAAKNLGTAIGSGYEGIILDSVNGLRLYNTDIKLYNASNALTVEMNRTDGLSLLADAGSFLNDAKRHIRWYDTVTSKTNVIAAVGGHIFSGTYPGTGATLKAFATASYNSAQVLITAQRAGSTGAAPQVGVAQQASSSAAWMLAEAIDLQTNSLKLTRLPGSTANRTINFGNSNVGEAGSNNAIFTGTALGHLVIQGVSPVWVGTSVANDLYLVTNNVRRVTVTSAGRVGVGVTGPSAMLDVRSEGSLMNAYLYNTAPSGANLLRVRGDGITSGSNYIYCDDTGVVDFRVRGDGLVYSRERLLLYGNHPAADQLFTGASAGDSGIRVDSGRLHLGTYHSHELALYTNNVKRMSVTGSGVIDFPNANFGGWTTVSYATGWGSYGGGYRAVQYRKVGDRVQMRGMAVQSGGTNLICTLPAGFRPALHTAFAVYAGSGIGRIDVMNDGRCLFYAGAGGTGSAVSFDTIEFSTN